MSISNRGFFASVLYLPLFFWAFSLWAVHGQEKDVVSLSSGTWKLAPQAEVTQTGEQISTAGFPTDSWLGAQIPGTVFDSYVLDGKEKDPNFGDNIYQVDLTKYDRNFWYRTDFTVPGDYNDRRIWLNLDGVNRDADIYVNGKQVGSMHGFFQRGRFDITALAQVGGKNSLAVLDYVPPPNVASKTENFSSPAFICTKGWDWMPRVPGFDMGIYKDVYLSCTGDVSLIDPWIRTENASTDSADLSIQADLQNNSSGDVTGELDGEINPGKIAFSQPVTIKGGETQTVNLTSANVPALHVANPKLWWPNGYGDPNLYTIRLSFRAGSSLSDQKTVTFGIRKYSYDTDNNTLHFHINGIPIFPKGGSWGMAEYLLRCNAKDYDRMVRFHREENFNIIRNWMGMTPDEAFYEACDKYGIMVWDEFWLNSSGGVPRDLDVYHANAIEKIKQFRNHACVALWCADNEGNPPGPINGWLQDAIKTYDANDRYYQPNSHAGNLSGSGPWHDFAPKNYFTGQGLSRGRSGPFGMRSEIGTATFTNFDSFKKFMPEDTWWPRNEMWNKHFFGHSANNAGPDGYFKDVNRRYGNSGGIEEFCVKAQLLNIETMKAIFEGWLDHIDKDAAGVIIWMSQSAYPSMVWQTYDYYYDLTGSYWGAKSACEPVHIYWNENDDRIRVANTSGKNVDGLTAEALIYNLDGTQKFEKKSDAFTSPADAVADCFTLTYPAELSPVHFIRLRLTDSSGKLVSENFYWRGTVDLDFKALNSLKKVDLGLSSHLSKEDGEDLMAATISNPAGSQTVAFAIRPMLIKPSTGDQILPVRTSDGYFSLMPGESKQITFRFDPALAGNEAPKVQLECYNNMTKNAGPDTASVLIGDLAQDKKVTASSNDSDGDGPDAIVDGDLTTRWASAWKADPQWIMVDLGKSESINRVKLTWEKAYAKSYELQVSDDGVAWTDIYQTTNGKGGVENLTGLNGQGRYIRMYGTERATVFGYSLYEFEVYGPGGPNPN
jgi:hypothetical protein